MCILNLILILGTIGFVYYFYTKYQKRVKELQENIDGVEEVSYKDYKYIDEFLNENFRNFNGRLIAIEHFKNNIFEFIKYNNESMYNSLLGLTKLKKDKATLEIAKRLMNDLTEKNILIQEAGLTNNNVYIKINQGKFYIKNGIIERRGIAEKLMI